MMDWPIFHKELLRVGNFDSSIAICTLWTQKDVICKSLPRDKYSVCANLYTPQGINFLIKNVLANPKIRYIIMCGKEMNGSGKALLDLMNKGVDKNNKIVDSEAYIDSNISSEMLKRFKDGVSLIDMRGKEDCILDTIDKLLPKDAFAEPVIIEEHTTPQAALTPENVFLIRSRTISENWLRILDVIMKFGEEKMSEYHIKQREVLDLVAVIEGKDDSIAPCLKFNDSDLRQYYTKFFNSEKPEGISYTYGERLFKYPLQGLNEKWTGEISSTFNQIENIIDHLKKTPYTRRAIAFTWNVDIDSNSDNPPCLTQVSWNIKNGILYQTSVIRSNDMFGAWPMNAFALKELQEKIANKLGIASGPLIIISNSAHIYENNWKECTEILEKYYTGNTMPFEQDRLGYFTISVKKDEILVEHNLADGRKSGFVFSGKSSSDLYRRILHENLVSRLDHASYLGMELFRAEELLRNAKEYIQG
jgi:thymidylate synthase